MTKLVMNINLERDAGKRVRIVKCSIKILEGKTGTLTSPFGNTIRNYVGVFLDIPLGTTDIFNLTPYDEVKVLANNDFSEVK